MKKKSIKNEYNDMLKVKLVNPRFTNESNFGIR